jgi:hypothetical protein
MNFNFDRESSLKVSKSRGIQIQIGKPDKPNSEPANSRFTIPSRTPMRRTQKFDMKSLAPASSECVSVLWWDLCPNHRPFNTRNIADLEGEGENVFRFRGGMSA